MMSGPSSCLRRMCQCVAIIMNNAGPYHVVPKEDSKIYTKSQHIEAWHEQCWAIPHT